MAQTMRPILLASATAASFLGLRASNPTSHGEACPRLACWMTAVAPSTSSRRKSSSPWRLILPGRQGTLVLETKGVRFRSTQGPTLYWPFVEIQTFDLLHPRRMVPEG